MKSFPLVILLSLLFLIPRATGCFAQSGGFSTSQTERQIGHSILDMRYGYDFYRYVFDVRDGVVNWSYSGPGGQQSGRFYCKRNVAGDIITTECTGIVYWQFAAIFIWDIVEKIQDIDNIRYKWAISALESAVSCFERTKKTSPNAYERVLLTFNTIKDAEEGKGDDSLWDVLCLFSYAMSEHELIVEDLYDYNF